MTRSRPVEELASLHRESDEAWSVSGTGMALPPGSLDILVHVHLQGGDDLLTLCVLDGIELDLDHARGEATLRTLPYDESRRDWDTRGSFDLDGDRLEVRILIDGSIVEISWRTARSSPSATMQSTSADWHSQATATHGQRSSYVVSLRPTDSSCLDLTLVGERPH